MKAYLFGFQIMYKSQFWKIHFKTGFVVQGHMCVCIFIYTFYKLFFISLPFNSFLDFARVYNSNNTNNNYY